MSVCLCVATGAAPPSSPRIRVGAVYEGCLQVPVVGSQHVRLTVLDEDRARVHMRGIVTADECFSFRWDGDDRYSISSSEGLSSALKRHHCRVTRVRYDAAEDVASASVRVFGVPATLTLRQVYHLFGSFESTAVYDD